MSGALLNLVRVLPLSDVLDHDYVAGSAPYSRFEEIPLVDPDGDPCAIPVSPSFQSRDPQFNFLVGDTGRVAQVIRRNLVMNIDHVGPEVAVRLEQWLQERALVYVAPNIGRHTLFSWRPMRMVDGAYASGADAYDLTGTWQMTEGVPLLGVRLWDDLRKFMTKESVAATPEHQLRYTPGGAGFGYPSSSINRWVPGYPEGAAVGGGAGNSGWSKGGVDAADITFTHVVNGFGVPDCPDSLQIDVAANTSADRYLYQRQIWDVGHGDYEGYTWTGSGTAVVVVWLKGRLPDGAFLKLAGGASADNSYDLSGVNLRGWTPIVIGDYDPDWSSALPQVTLDLSNSTDHGASFEIGPMMAQQRSGTHSDLGAHWCDGTVSTDAPNYKTVDTFTMPKAGTIIASFYVPEGFNTTGPYSVCTVIGANVWALHVGSNTTDVAFAQLTTSSGTVYFATSTGAGRWREGRVNTVALTYGTGETRLYANGVPLDAHDRATDELDFGATPFALEMGNGYANYGCYPIALLTARIDEGAAEAAEIENIHLALTDPIALAFAATCRGRQFEITGVPKTVRDSLGGSQILGPLSLQQAKYTNDYADPMNREENKR